MNEPGSIFQDQDGIIAHVDRDLIITRLEILDDSEDERNEDSLVGKNWYEAMIGLSEPIDDCPIKMAFDEGRSCKGIIEGTHNIYLVRCYPIPDSNSEITGAIIISQDIVGVDKSDMPLEAFFRAHLSRWPDPVLIFDFDTMHIVGFNDNAHQLFGYTRVEFTNLPFYVLEEKQNPEYVKTILDRIISGESGNIEITTRTKSGELKFIGINLKQVDYFGRTMFRGVIHDLTGIKQVESRLRKSEAQYRTLVEASPDIIMEIELDGTILYVNRVLKGLRNEDAVGTNIMDYMPPEEHTRIRNLLNRSIGKRRNTEFQVSMMTPAGSRWWNTRALPQEKDGKIANFLLITTDVTDEKRAQDALIMSEERYRNLVENSPLPIFVHRDGSFHYVNPMLLKLLDIKNADELLGTPVINWIHPDDRKKIQNLLPTSHSTSKSAMKADFRTIRPDGEILDLASSTITVNYEGELACIVVLNDVTDKKRIENELKASEQKYRYLTENMRDAVFLMDLNWQHQYISPSIEQIRGFTPEEINDLPIEDSLPPESLANAKMLLEQSLARGARDENGEPIVATFEQLENCKDGSQVWTEVNATFVFNENDEPVGIIGCTRDISERKEAEEILEKERANLEQIIELNPMAIAIINPEGRMESHNQAFFDFFKSVPPDDYDVFNDPHIKKAGHDELMLKAKTGETVIIPPTFYNPHLADPKYPSAPHWIRITIFSIRDSNGNIEKYIFMCQDVTDLHSTD